MEDATSHVEAVIFHMEDATAQIEDATDLIDDGVDHAAPVHHAQRLQQPTYRLLIMHIGYNIPH